MQQQEEAQQEYFEIPRIFKLGFEALLVATQTDLACGVVREIRCQLCPDAKFRKWGDFVPHEVDREWVYF